MPQPEHAQCEFRSRHERPNESGQLAWLGPILPWWAPPSCSASQQPAGQDSQTEAHASTTSWGLDAEQSQGGWTCRQGTERQKSMPLQMPIALPTAALHAPQPAGLPETQQRVHDLLSFFTAALPPAYQQAQQHKLQTPSQSGSYDGYPAAAAVPAIVATTTAAAAAGSTAGSTAAAATTVRQAYPEPYSGCARAAPHTSRHLSGTHAKQVACRGLQASTCFGHPFEPQPATVGASISGAEAIAMVQSAAAVTAASATSAGLSQYLAEAVQRQGRDDQLQQMQPGLQRMQPDERQHFAASEALSSRPDAPSKALPEWQYGTQSACGATMSLQPTRCVHYPGAVSQHPAKVREQIWHDGVNLTALATQPHETVACRALTASSAAAAELGQLAANSAQIQAGELLQLAVRLAQGPGPVQVMIDPLRQTDDVAKEI